MNANCVKTCHIGAKELGSHFLEEAEILPSWEEATPGAKESATRPERDPEALRGKRIGKQSRRKDKCKELGPGGGGGNGGRGELPGGEMSRKAFAVCGGCPKFFW